MAYKAFVSSTFEDLKDHRAHVIRSLQRAGFFVDPMEEWPADSEEPKRFSQDRLSGCDLCVLLIAFRRGYVTFPRFRGHPVKPPPSSLRTWPGNRRRGSSDDATDDRTLRCTQRCPVSPHLVCGIDDES